MPYINFQSDFPSSIAQAFSFVDEAMLRTTIAYVYVDYGEVWLSSDSAYAYYMRGTGITTTTISGEIQLTGGTLSELYAGSKSIEPNVFTGIASITDFHIDAVTLRDAAQAELTHTNPAALEHLFYGLGWHYYGNDAEDILLSTTKSADGILMNLKGNDRFLTMGGDDHVFLGDGNDYVDGGIGLDTLEGGKGNDRLLGGGGADHLFGGSGADRLNGGKGSDTLIGGLGSDTFLFKAGDGHDRITGFNTAQDRIELAPGTAHSVTTVGHDTTIHYGPGTDTILLVGIDAAHASLITFI